MDSKWAKSRKREEVIGRDSPSKTLKTAQKMSQNGLKKTQNGQKIEKVKRLLGGTVPQKD